MMLKFYEYLNELAMKVPEDLKIKWNPSNEYAVTHIGDTKLNITFSKSKTESRYKVDFGVYDRGKAKPLDIFMAVMETIKQGVKKLNAKELWLLPADLKRSNIYKRMIIKLLPSGWTFSETEHPFEEGAKVYLLKKG